LIENGRDNTISTLFLCGGCQTRIDVAHRLARFVSQAQHTIDIAAYSFSLCPESRDIVIGALEERVAAGVQVRIAYDAGTQQAVMPYHQDPCDFSTEQFLASVRLHTRPIEGFRALMHHKYIVLDGNTDAAQVWTGSTNFTDESWELQENNIVVFESKELSEYFQQDFDELWTDGDIVSSGILDSGETTLQYGGKPAYVLVNFSPGEGDWIDESIANVIERARERVSIASVVVTSTRILRALQDVMRRGVPIDGIYDWSQMEGVKYQWRNVEMNRWKIPAFAEIVKYGNLVGKASTPYAPGSRHDYMHNKVVVADDTVLTGSYNFSRHAQKNAENSLMITSAPLAETYRKYINRITGMYAPMSQPFTAQEEAQPVVKEAPETTR
jgi:phosphatidylserine/phosphatidylglycerophosphate/cardiolipin synthase-like enzyme